MINLFVLFTSPFGLFDLRIASIAYSILLLVILLFLIPMFIFRNYFE